MESIEKGQIIFSKIFLIFKLKYLNNYLIKLTRNLNISLLNYIQITIKIIYIYLLTYLGGYSLKVKQLFVA